jgi:hypothetical protein
MLMTFNPAINGWAIFSEACRVMAKRLRDVYGLPESEPLWRAKRGFVVRDLPWTVEKLRVILADHEEHPCQEVTPRVRFKPGIRAGHEQHPCP